jgi:glyoxylase-like metal-dependent hydrolase (beta-lactamase superfamily II)
MEIKAFFDPETWTLTYVVWDTDTRDAVVIDPVLDFDPLAVRVHEKSIGEVVAYVREHGLNVHYVLDTHAHADHLSGFQGLKRELGAKIGIGEQIGKVQAVFKGLFNLHESFPTDGSQWDVLLRDGEALHAGSLTIEPIHTPGHTPADYTYKIRDAIFTGDTMFMPDFGTGRCDFPGGSAEDLYDSITTRLYTLPDETRVFVGHDYQPGGRELRYETSIGASKLENIQLRADTDRAQFVQWRKERDATLRPPRLIFQSLIVNADAGRLPAPEANGISYLKMPIGVFS